MYQLSHSKCSSLQGLLNLNFVWQGYQSRLQISIGAGGLGSVTAARTLAPPQRPVLRPATSLPNVTTTPIMPPQLNESSLQQLPPTTKGITMLYI